MVDHDVAETDALGPRGGNREQGNEQERGDRADFHCHTRWACRVDDGQRATDGETAVSPGHGSTTHITLAPPV